VEERAEAALAERERRDQHKAEENRARQMRQGVLTDESEEEVEEEEAPAPKPKRRAPAKKK